MYSTRIEQRDEPSSSSSARAPRGHVWDMASWTGASPGVVGVVGVVVVLEGGGALLYVRVRSSLCSARGNHRATRPNAAAPDRQ